MVEHDPDTIAAADQVIDLGPGAGELGENYFLEPTKKSSKILNPSLVAT